MYWIDSKATKIIWLGLLFSMMHLAELSYAEEAKTEPSALAGKYKMRTVQCLISSDYTTPVGYTIETLMLYIEAEWMTFQDPTIETSMVLGQAIRLAMRMGIHRDSGAFPNITPFRREMRRRLWAAIHRADILYSFQLSLPLVIRQSDCDCGLPMNIRNEDFGEDMDLPPSRGLHEATEVSYLIIKYQLLLVVGNIIESTNIKGSMQIDSIEKLERSLSEARQKIPPYLQIAEAENLEPLSSKKVQISLDRVFQLGKCLLYRKFLHRRDNPSFLKYRGSCIDAAMKLLSYQSAIFMKPGSNFPENVKTRNMSTLISHDFFVAGMVVALDLHHGLEVENVSPSPSDMAIWGFSRRTEMVNALETSTQFWGYAKDVSTEAAEAYGLFSLILKKVKDSLSNLGETRPIRFDSGEQLGGFLDTEPLDGITEFNWVGEGRSKLGRHG
jgi:hypothetical protein